MATRDSDLERLLRAARGAEEHSAAEVELPFGFETRVVSRARAFAREHSGDAGVLVRLIRRVAVAAVIVTAFAGIGAYWQVSENEAAAEPLSNAYAIADSAIESGVFQ